MTATLEKKPVVQQKELESDDDVPLTADGFYSQAEPDNIEEFSRKSQKKDDKEEKSVSRKSVSRKESEKAEISEKSQKSQINEEIEIIKEGNEKSISLESEHELDTKEMLPPSRYSYISRRNAEWVDQTLGSEGIARLGEKPHPVELIFELTCHFVPSLRDMPNTWKTPRNRLKSKLRKVREFFIAWDIQSPLHWCPFVDFVESSEKFVLNFNTSVAAMRNHFLLEEYNQLLLEQKNMVQMCRSMYTENEAQRNKLMNVIKVIDENPDLPFGDVMKSLIEKEPSCFKPLEQSQLSATNY